jgi:DNA-binding NtrC family response regulator
MLDSAVLFVSPYDQDALTLARILNDIPAPVEHAYTIKDAARRLAARHYSVVLTEAALDDGSWRDVLSLARGCGAPVVVTDAWADARTWAEAINVGAYDMLAQPFRATEVMRVLAGACSNRPAAKIAISAAC